MQHSYEQLEPAELVRLAGARDQAAWRELVRRYAPLVWRVARSHRLDAADAGDVCQNTWLTLADRLGRIQDPERIAGWLATTARREALRVIRSRRREVDPSCLIEFLADTAVDRCPESRVLRTVRDRLLWRAFALLPERCQRLLAILSHAPGTSYEQVAAALGIKPGSIGQSRGRCLAELRRRLAVVGVTEGAAG